MATNDIGAAGYGAADHTRHKGSTWRHGAPYLYLVPALLYLAVTLVYPIYSNVRMSLHDVNIGTFLAADQPWVGLDNYRTLFDDPAFWNAVRLSLIFTAGSIVFQFAIGLALALLFNSPFPGNNILQDGALGAFAIIGDVTTPAVPLPGALPLFATGLGALGLLGWRRKRKHVA